MCSAKELRLRVRLCTTLTLALPPKREWAALATNEPHSNPAMQVDTISRHVCTHWIDQQHFVRIDYSSSVCGSVDGKTSALDGGLCYKQACGAGVF